MMMTMTMMSSLKMMMLFSFYFSSTCHILFFSSASADDWMNAHYAAFYNARFVRLFAASSLQLASCAQG